MKASIPRQLACASKVPATVGALLLAFASPPSVAQAVHEFDIQAPSLGAALLELSRQSGVTIVVAPELTQGTPPQVLKARLSPDEALQRLLEGTGLRAVRTPAGGYVIERAPMTATKTALQEVESPSAAAAEASTRQSAAETLIDTIVVTARKKSAAENAQDVPISLSAVSGEQIEAQFAKDLTDVGQRMPNVRLDTIGVFPGIANYAIRGTGYVSGIASTEPTVGVFVDGVYLGVNLGGAPDTFDLESVEVLRGPQGTLFGRNVTGGAVVMRSRRPSGDFHTGVRVGAGSGDRYSVAGSIEGGLTETLAAKLFASYSHRGGDFDNVFLNDEHGEERTTFVRPILRWRPHADLDITAIFEHGETKGDGPFSRILNDPASMAYLNSGLREPRGTDKLSMNQTGKTDIEWNQIVLDANWNVGPGTLTSITGYRDVSYYSSGDGDGSSAEISTGITWTEQDQFSEELRFASQAFDGKLDYTVGVYYFEQKMDQQYRLDLFGNPTFLTNGELDHETASAFAQGDYEFVPGVFLTAGLRYTWERKRAKIARGNNCDTAFNCTFPFRDSHEWNNLSPKLGLSWKITDDILAYASWTKGFRSGGYNTRTTGATESPGPYDEEIVRSYEVGLKSEFWDRRARVNLAVFHDKYSDLQRTVFDPVLFSNRIANAASAKVDGAELDVSLLPLDGLVLTASVGYLDARYARFDSLDVTGDSIPDPELAKGLQLIRAPDWTYSVAATYDLDLGAAGSLISRAAYSYSADSPLNDADTRRLDSYGLLDASITWSRRMAGDELSVSLWGKNLTNEKYGLTGATSVLFTTIYQGLPRTWGVEFSYRR